MTVFVVLALLASNIFLAKMLLSKDKEKADSPSTDAASDNTPDPPKNNNEGVSDASVENPIEEKIASVVGESKYDPDTYKQIIKEIVKEVVPLIIEEYGNFADAGFPELEDKKSSIVVPNDKLDEVFSNTTVAELTGEAPEPTEPCADSLDFNDMTTTMNVLKEKSDNPEDMEVAQETLRKLDGTVIKEKLSLDPAIQKKIRKRKRRILFQNMTRMTPLNPLNLSRTNLKESFSTLTSTPRTLMKLISMSIIDTWPQGKPIYNLIHV